MAMPQPALWIPWLFALLTLLFAVPVIRALAAGRRPGEPALKARFRVAIIFALVTLVLFVWL